jgi:hypothetical protein
MKPWKYLAGSAVALGLLTGTAQAASITPAAGASTAAADANATQQVQWRRGWGYRRGWRGPGIGLGLGVIGGLIIANEIYRPRRGYYYDDYAYSGPYYYPSGYTGDPRRICAQNFRSFEWNTGLYTTYSGEKRLCPYLQ